MKTIVSATNDWFFILNPSFPSRRAYKDAGFKWNPALKLWVDKNPRHAARLVEEGFAKWDSFGKKLHDTMLIQVTEAFPQLTVGGELLRRKLVPKPYQLEAAHWALTRNRSYIALDPGLGKTIVMALILNELPFYGLLPVIISPAGLVRNVKSELQKWDCLRRTNSWDYAVVSDTVLSSDVKTNQLVRSMEGYSSKLPFKVLFVDEAQRFNSMESKRTKNLFKLEALFDKIVFFSGTPIRNRPVELYPILSRFAPETIDFCDAFTYGMKYCAGRADDPYKGWDFSGASNTEELFSKVKEKFMFRRTKADVQDTNRLPGKTEEMVFLSKEAPAEVTAFERRHLRNLSPEDLMKPKITKSPHVSTYRRMLGEAKAPMAALYIENILLRAPEVPSVLVFAEHVKVVEELAKFLGDWMPFVLTGKTPVAKRSEMVEAFQKDKGRRLFIGNTQACGVGFTLTKATRVIHVEPSWVPADSDQASDRAHRIGQTKDVLVQYLVFKNSLDRAVLESAIRKRETLRLL